MKYFNLLLLIYLVFLLESCHVESNQTITVRLQKWDEMLDNNPEAVKDSLMQINPVSLSRFNRAYYGLLKTIADDKNYISFDNDSLISETKKQLENTQKGSELHIRSLIYQGIVRYRIGITDSTAFISLKEAEQLYVNLQTPNPQIGYLMYYYLGKTLEYSDNDDEASLYYKKALQSAQKENSKMHIFDAYMALYWNEIINNNLNAGKNYLDTLESFTDISADATYFLLNAKGVFFELEGNYKAALNTIKERLTLLSEVKTNVMESRLYFSLSKAYRNIHVADSAMYYGLQAIEHTKDTLYQHNYLLFENVAEIAEIQGDFETADHYRKEAAKSYKRVAEQTIKTQILELEKKYNNASAENKTLKARVITRTMFAITLALFAALVMVITLWRRHKKIAQLEKNHAATKLKLLEQQSDEKLRMISIVLSYINLHSLFHNQLLEFINITRSKDSKLADRLDILLKNNRLKLNETTQHVFTDEFISNTLGISQGIKILTPSDRLLLFMLSINADNDDIAALLNTTPINLKSKKSYLKKKINSNYNKFDRPEKLLSLF